MLETTARSYEDVNDAIKVAQLGWVGLASDQGSPVLRAQHSTPTHTDVERAWHLLDFKQGLLH